MKNYELANLRQELKDLEATTVRQDTPLSPYMMGIAQAKIATLQHQIKELEETRATLTSLQTSSDLV